MPSNHVMSMHPIRSQSFHRNSGSSSVLPRSGSGLFERYVKEISNFFRGRTRIRQIFFTLCSRKHGHGHATLVKTCYDMNLSPLIRIGKILLASGFASALPMLALGQTGYISGGGEYPI